MDHENGKEMAWECSRLHKGFIHKTAQKERKRTGEEEEWRGGGEGKRSGKSAQIARIRQFLQGQETGLDPLHRGWAQFLKLFRKMQHAPHH